MHLVQLLKSLQGNGVRFIFPRKIDLTFFSGNQHGATLVELVVTIVVISIAAVTLVIVTSQATQRSVDPMIQEQAAAIALAYMEEVMQKSFCDPDDDEIAGEACVTRCSSPVCSTCSLSAPEPARDLYDDICDYDGLNDSGARNQLGNLVSGLGQYTVTVEVDDTAQLNTLLGNDGRTARIDVTVSHPAMEDDVEASGFRSNY